MSLEEVNHIAEIIGSIAVVASLIYVALQVRHNTAATRAAAGQAYVDGMNASVSTINTSSNLADVLHRGANGLPNLKDGEIIQFGAFLDQNFILYEAYFLQWKAGVLDGRLWSIFGHCIADLLAQPGQQQWWETRRHWFDREFTKYIEEVIVAGESKPMHPFSVGPSTPV